MLRPFFDMFQAGVEHFLYSAEFGAPEVAHIVEAMVDGIELCIHEQHHDSEQGSVEEQGDSDGEIELLVGHQGKWAPSGFILAWFSPINPL